VLPQWGFVEGWLVGWLVPLNTLYVISGTIETSWSSRSGLNPTRITPPCYNNTTLSNRLYAQLKGPSVTNAISLISVRTAHISVLLTLNIVWHNLEQSNYDNIFSEPPDNHHNSDVYQRGWGFCWRIQNVNSCCINDNMQE